MPFPWTLQRYIFREMGKTFLLAAIALTGVLGFGGGILNIIKLGEATPEQLVRLVALLIPIAASLTLPIAALFSAAATYGRLSADNEFVACRSSGINMHVLFIPTVVLSLLAATASFGLTNYLIPGMVRNLNEFVAADVGTLIQQRLSRPRGLTLGNRYRIYADASTIDPLTPNRVTLHHVAFMEIDGEQWVRYGTAREVRLDFQRGEDRIRVSGSMMGLSFYDQKLDRFLDQEEQTIPPNDVRTLVPPRIKFLNLSELMHYRARPGEWHEVRRQMRRLRKAVCCGIVYDELRRDMADDHTLVLEGRNGLVTVKAERLHLEPGAGRLSLLGVAVSEQGSGERLEVTAERAILRVTRGETLAESSLSIEALNARVRSGTEYVSRAKTEIGPLAIPPRLIDRCDAVTDAELLRPGPLTDGDVLSKKRRETWEIHGATVRKIVGAIHERIAFSVSVFVLLIFGAVLGIIFRGAHLMTAFGVSFVPMLFVLITIVMGKQMSHNAATHGVGLVVIWSGIVIVAGLDVWTLTRVLRR